jgi:hypothetical protein
VEPPVALDSRLTELLKRSVLAQSGSNWAAELVVRRCRGKRAIGHWAASSPPGGRFLSRDHRWSAVSSRPWAI